MTPSERQQLFLKFRTITNDGFSLVDHALTIQETAGLRHDVLNGWDVFQFIDEDKHDFDNRLFFVSEIICPCMEQLDLPELEAEIGHQAHWLTAALVAFVATEPALTAKRTLKMVHDLLSHNDMNSLFAYLTTSETSIAANYVKHRTHWPLEQTHFFKSICTTAQRFVLELLP